MSSRLLASLRFAALTLVTAVAACDSADSAAGPGTGPVPVATVSVAAAVPTLVAGQTTTVSATLHDAAGQPITGRAIAWSSTNEAVATVATSGEVVAIAEGTARIRATSEGKTGEVELTVRSRASLVTEVTLDVSTLVLTAGESRQLGATPRDAQGNPVAGVSVAWSVAGATPAVAISATGVVTAREMGRVTITASVGDRSAQATVTVLGDATHDLVFERWATTGGFEQPFLHRLDLVTPDANSLALFGSGGTFDASPSPDGSKLAFTCTTGHSTGICVSDADGSGATLLPGFGELAGLRADQPAWSPDGTRIAFRGWAMGGDVGIFNPGDIWVMNADGSNRVKLTSGVANVDSYESPTWSPRLADGSFRLAFSRVSRHADGFMRSSLESMRANGTDRLPLTAPGSWVDAEPSWSPDGATIAFVRTGGEAGGDIWLVNAAGGNERPLMSAGVEPTGAQRSPAWSPDGAQVAFTSNHEIIANYVAWQVYTVRADGTGLLRRTSDRAEKGRPAWIKR